MREVVGVWYGRRQIVVYLEDGYLKFDLPHGIYENPRDFKKKFGERFFGDSNFWANVEYDVFERFLVSCLNLCEEDFLKKIEEKKRQREAYHNRGRKEDSEWQATREKFNGYVIGVDKKVDVYGSGFSVRVVFSSDISFREKSKFLRENRVEFVKWVMEEMTKSKKIMNRIGCVKFYRPVEIINLRAQEVEVKFEVKKEVVA